MKRRSWKTRGKVVPDHERKIFSNKKSLSVGLVFDGKSDDPKKTTTYGALYDMAMDLVYSDITVVDITEGATHYHADYVYVRFKEKNQD